MRHAREGANLTRGCIEEKERFASLSLASLMSSLQGESGSFGHLFIGHLVEAPNLDSGLTGEVSQGSDYFSVRTAKHQGSVVVPGGRSRARTAGGNRYHATVLHDERIGISNRFSQRSDFRPRFASAKHQRDGLSLQFFESRAGAFPRVRVVGKQASVQVRED